MGWKWFKGDQLVRQVAEAEHTAVKHTLEQIGEIADTQVPLDEGTLLRSKYIQVDDSTGFISYGGGRGTGYPKVPYALRWHEENANFQRGRKKDYLRDPLNKDGPRLFKLNMTEELKQVFK